ncbi:MAG: alpha/beta fold hydrolase [Acetobacteraceae bacterium]|nr:alpha/beta fold hydrolase [Acetobacteraceae bacterium]
MSKIIWRAEDGSAELHPALVPLAASARVAETPCGSGSMVWRAWGEGAPLVLLHGGSGSWRHWARNIGPLGAGRMVIAPDLPGLGDSAMPEGVSTPDGVAAILARGLDHILPAGSRYDLAGFSFGALCSGHLAALDQDRVRSLTIIGAGALGFQRSPTQLVKVRALAGEERVASHRHNLAELMFADASRIDDVALAIQEASTRGARFKSRGFASTDSLKQALMRGQGQLNAIYGEWDAIVRPHVQLRLDLVRGLRPGARAHAIPGAGHWVAYEAAEAFNATLLRFLTEQP